MPELPEVETVKAALLPLVEGRTIQHVRQMRSDLRWPLPERLADRLTGRRCGTAYRRAKYILIPLDGHEVLLIHLGMSGAIRIYEHQPEFAKHDHISVQLDTGQWFVFSDPRRFGHVDLISDSELETHKLLRHLGIEPLSNMKPRHPTGEQGELLLSNPSLHLFEKISEGIGSDFLLFPQKLLC